MRFGYCTGFATAVMSAVDYALLVDIQAAGYDYAEFPLALVAALSDSAFDELDAFMKTKQLGADACCNMFPSSLRLTGPEADFEEAAAYLRRAIPRMARLGAKTIVFGSSGARNLPKGTTPQEGYRQLAAFLAEHVIPLLEEHDLTLAVEPIGSYEANFINTLRDGMELVNRVNHPRVRLLADSVHVLYQGEDMRDVCRFAAHLRHVHVCEPLRALPVPAPSAELEDFLRVLRETGYGGGVSFEPMPYPREDMARALAILRERLA